MHQILNKIIYAFIAILCASCTANINPHDFSTADINLPNLLVKPSTSISVEPHLVDTKERAIPLVGFNIVVSENEFTKVLTTKIQDSLKSKNIAIDPSSNKVIKIQVSRVSLQPDMVMNCVIDYNLKLGNGLFYGFQTRSKNWNFKTACEKALKNAVNEILNNQSMVKYIKEK